MSFETQIPKTQELLPPDALNTDEIPGSVNPFGNYGDALPYADGHGVIPATETAAANTSESERGAASFEFAGAAVDAGTIAINGIRYMRARYRFNKIEELEEAAAAHREIAEAAYYGRPVDRALRPETVVQRKRSIKSTRRMKRNMSRGANNFYLEEIYGTDIGEPTYNHGVTNSRYGRKHERMAVRAGHKYDKNLRVVERRTNRVRRSAQGEDIPGTIINTRLERLRAKTPDNIHAHLRGLSQEIIDAQLSREDRSERRKRERKNARAAVVRGGKTAAKTTGKVMYKAGKDYVETLGSTSSAYQEGKSGVSVSTSQVQQGIDRLARRGGRAYANFKARP